MKNNNLHDIMKHSNDVTEKLDNPKKIANYLCQLRRMQNYCNYQQLQQIWQQITLIKINKKTMEIKASVKIIEGGFEE